MEGHEKVEPFAPGDKVQTVLTRKKSLSYHI